MKSYNSSNLWEEERGKKEGIQLGADKSSLWGASMFCVWT